LSWLSGLLNRRRRPSEAPASAAPPARADTIGLRCRHPANGRRPGADGSGAGVRSELPGPHGQRLMLQPLAARTPEASRTGGRRRFPCPNIAGPHTLANRRPVLGRLGSSGVAQRLQHQALTMRAGQLPERLQRGAVSSRSPAASLDGRQRSPIVSARGRRRGPHRRPRLGRTPAPVQQTGEPAQPAS